jgi:GNAT superfamily N-acetyltransferase
VSLRDERESGMDINIHRGTVHDAQGVVDVINSVIQEGGLTALYPMLSVEQEEAFIEGLGPRSALFIAESSGAALGVQVIEPFAPYTRAMDHVATIGTFVYRNFRRQGVGRRLMEATLDFARRQGYEKIITYVRVSNSGAQTFYRRMGFLPKLMLERQIKIEGRYDDEVLIEFFIPQPEAPAVVAAQREAAVVPVARAEQPQVAVRPAQPRVEPPVEAPVVVEAAPAGLTVAVDPMVGALTVRRAKRQDVRTLTAIMKGTMRWRVPPTEEQVLEMLFDKGYWLAMSRKGGGLTGWRAENLVMCIDDFYVYPPQYYTQIGGPLLETVETEAKFLSCEVAIAFLEERIAPEAVQFFESQGYARQQIQDLFSIWRTVAQEFLTGHRFMMVKKLRERHIMRPI